MPDTAYIIVADFEIDQICETRTDARREAKDLRDMGHVVRVITCEWDMQSDAIAMIEGTYY